MRPVLLFTTLLLWLAPQQTQAQRLEEVLQQADRNTLAEEARENGNARQGAVLFYQQSTACRKCHLPTPEATALGPDLSKWEKKPTDGELIEAILYPSKTIRKGFEPVTIIEDSGKIRNGLLVQETETEIVYRSLETNNLPESIARESVDEMVQGKQSLMPDGLVNLLANRGQFLNLLKYLMEIRDGGEQVARLLKPPRHLYETPPLPVYEANIDHVGFLNELNQEAFQRGEAIYNRVCMNCHGTKDKPGSLPTSLKFASERFRNGSDPYTMYQTVTRGFGMMPAQYQLVPQQKHDVVYYIREEYVKKHNPSQYVPITPDYLSGIPKGTERGPEPLDRAPWIVMNYGNSLINTYEAGQNSGNFNYKGIGVRVDPGPGGLSQGNHWMVFDHDTLRLGAAWSGQGFIDWNGIHFNGKHGVHPTTAGEVEFFNPVGPGWAHPETGSWDDPRLRGRDDKPYGPLPREWAHYKGLYRHGSHRVISYTVAETPVLESPLMVSTKSGPVYARQMAIGPHQKTYSLSVASLTEDRLFTIDTKSSPGQQTLFAHCDELKSEPNKQPLEFDGASYAQVSEKQEHDFTQKDFTVTARIKTKRGGTIFSQTVNGPKWVPDAKALFVRDGLLCYDIGWVGVVRSKTKFNDGKWHDVAMSWKHKTGEVRLYIDGQLDQSGRLKPNGDLQQPVIRLGFASPNFPKQSFFAGNIAEVNLFDVSKAPGSAERNRTGRYMEYREIRRWLVERSIRKRSRKDPPGHSGHRDAFKHPCRGDWRKWSTSIQKPPFHLGIAPLQKRIQIPRLGFVSRK